MPKRSSRCSAGTPLTLIWAGVPTPGHSDGIDAAVANFEVLVKTANREWDPRAWAILKAEFKSRLRRACGGRLIPVTHVKEIDRGAKEHVFEIKHDFNVIIRVEGKRRSQKVRVRFYISEPPNELSTILGLHIHEKTTVPGDRVEENRLQNIEIDVAIRYYDLGRATNWGI